MKSRIVAIRVTAPGLYLSESKRSTENSTRTSDPKVAKSKSFDFLRDTKLICLTMSGAIA